jgi:membrane fusion protein (multidrug efflux system)
MRIFAIVALAGLLFAGAYVYLKDSGAQSVGGSGRPPAAVTAFTVEDRVLQDEISALGNLQAWESVDISASVSQIVTRIRFEDGQSVERGDVLALLKQDAEQASLRELQANLVEAEREVRRLNNLARQNQVAQTELDKATTRVEIVQHQIEEVRARIADRTIVAPFSGLLGLREVSEGALVTPGQRLTTLDDLSRMRLQFTVPAVHLGFLAPGQRIEARTSAFDTLFSGQLQAVDSRIDPVSRSVTARAVIDNSDGRLRPGLLMELTIRGAQRSALMVPEESLQSRAAQHFVWRLEDADAVRTEIAIGARIPGWVEVRSGLAAGDRVVRDGVGKLGGERAKVTVVEG